MSAGDELVEVWARDLRAAAAVMAADVVELRARNLCREAEPHGARAVPCPEHVVEARRQLGGTA